jgi:hypothetical protein
MSVLPSSLRHRIIAQMHQSYLTMRLPAPVEAPLSALERTLYDGGLDDVAIDRPIFIVGCHRSGTTVLYEALAKHPDMAYFTNASNGMPRLPILANKVCYGLGLDETVQERFLRDDVLFTATTPNEGVQIWELHAPAGENHCLDETYDNPRMDRYLTLTIKKHLKFFGARRFINKNPDSSVRMRYLNKLFPDAYFIHIVRDARAVCSSLIKARGLALDFFGPAHRYAKFGIKVQDWEGVSRAWRENPVAGSGLLWREVIETIARDRRHIDPQRFMEVRYEDVVAQPREVLGEITRFCALPRHSAADAALARAADDLKLEGRNDAWRRRLSDEDVACLMGIIGPTMRAHGYTV